MGTQYEQDPTVNHRFVATYLYAKDKLGLPEEEAVNLARTEIKRDRFFFEAFRLRHNLPLRLVYFLPQLIFIIFLLTGFLFKTHWWFYGPALLLLLIWMNSRKWSSFWTPILYWLKPYIKKPVVAKNGLDPTDWRSYFFIPYPQGEANISQMVNACYEEVSLFGNRVLFRSVVVPHLLYLGGFFMLAYFAWK